MQAETFGRAVAYEGAGYDLLISRSPLTGEIVGQWTGHRGEEWSDTAFTFVTAQYPHEFGEGGSRREAYVAALADFERQEMPQESRDDLAAYLAIWQDVFETGAGQGWNYKLNNLRDELSEQFGLIFPTENLTLTLTLPNVPRRDDRFLSRDELTTFIRDLRGASWQVASRENSQGLRLAPSVTPDRIETLTDETWAYLDETGENEDWCSVYTDLATRHGHVRQSREIEIDITWREITTYTRRVTVDREEFENGELDEESYADSYYGESIESSIEDIETEAV